MIILTLVSVASKGNHLHAQALQAPTVISVTPSSGSGWTQSFTATFSHVSGYWAVTSSHFVIENNNVTAGLWDAGACHATYDANWGAMSLWNDAGTGWTPTIIPGSSAITSNSQCTLNGIGSSVSGSGSDLTVTFSITFTPNFAGGKTLNLEAATATPSNGWFSSAEQQLGTWTVPTAANQAPGLTSLTPSSGSGSAQIFTAVFSHPSGYSAVTASHFVIENSGVTAGLWDAGTCHPNFDANHNTMQLWNDAGNGWTVSITPGTNATTANSQCILNAIGSSTSGSGNYLTVVFSITFQNTFAGPKTLNTEAAAANTTGWYVGALQQWGNWTVTGNWAVVTSYNLTDFQACIGPSGTAETCVLAANSYTYNWTLYIWPLEFHHYGRRWAGGNDPSAGEHVPLCHDAGQPGSH
jgi:hypothetical protein